MSFRGLSKVGISKKESFTVETLASRTYPRYYLDITALLTFLVLFSCKMYPPDFSGQAFSLPQSYSYGQVQLLYLISFYT